MCARLLPAPVFKSRLDQISVAFARFPQFSLFSKQLSFGMWRGISFLIFWIFLRFQSKLSFLKIYKIFSPEIQNVTRQNYCIIFQMELKFQPLPIFLVTSSTCRFFLTKLRFSLIFRRTCYQRILSGILCAFRRMCKFSRFQSQIAVLHCIVPNVRTALGIISTPKA